jgi:hypothetical protein
MTEQEAINEIKSILDKPFPLTIGRIEALKMGIIALEKQIPKKPIREKDGSLVCSNCKSFEGIRLDTSFNTGFCWECGQAVDGGDIE